MLPTTVSTVWKRVVTCWELCWAAVALLQASRACGSASLALSEASLMPAWVRASVSLIALPLEEVISSSSLTRSRIGSVWRCTYFLRAKGLTRPQKPSRDGAARGALPLALELSDEVD